MSIRLRDAPFPTPLTRQVADRIKRLWRAGEDPDAVAALAIHDQLATVKSVVIELAYEEYCLREKAGRCPDADQFCAKFPRYRSSLRRVLDVHRLTAEQPQLLTVDPGEWPVTGSHFEGLEITDELGCGAFGRAYLAFEPGTGRDCVLKVSGGRSVEARVIASLKHPHITDVLWARTIGRLTAVCMPLLGVSTLDDIRDAAFGTPSDSPLTSRVILNAIELIDDGPATSDTPQPPIVDGSEPYALGIAAIFFHIVDALRYLHARGASHGDLKPSNVVLGRNGHPYLIDFNLSRTDGSPVNGIGGTLPYMAPEQLRLLLAECRADADASKVDVYAFGVMLFELLTGRVPFVPIAPGDTRATAADLLGQIMSFDHRTHALPGVPSFLSVLINGCLAPDPNDRPTSAEVFRRLEACLQAQRPHKRTRKWRRAAIIVGAVLLVGIGWTVVSNANIWRSRPPLAASKEPKNPSTAEEYFARGQEFLHQSQYPSAMSDFGSAIRLTDDPKMSASAAHCAALMGEHAQAIGFGNDAVAKGASDAATLNNLGYSYIKNGQPVAAIPNLDRALERAPGLQAGYYNRAIARHMIATAKGQFDPGAATDIDTALATGQESAQLHHSAALIYAAGQANDSGFRAKMFRCLTRAVELGKDPNHFKREPLFQSFANDADFKRLLASEPGPARPVPPLQLLDPILP
jgi:eukaryotic-like serine/threonine-protein kinase